MSNKQPRARSYLDLLRDEPWTGYTQTATLVVSGVTFYLYGPEVMFIALVAMLPLLFIAVTIDPPPVTAYQLMTRRLAYRLRGAKPWRFVGTVRSAIRTWWRRRSD